MKKPKHFIAVTTETSGNRLVKIATSAGVNLYNENGIAYDAAISFLFDLIHLRRDDRTTVFVCYAFSRDNEFIFSTMPTALKDKLFCSEPIKRQLHYIENENEALDTLLYNGNEESQEYQQADFERHVNGHAVKDLTEVTVNGYQIKLASGKSLLIRKGGKVFTLYDIYGFFKPQALRKAVRQWTGKDLALLDRKLLEALDIPEKDKIDLHALLETTAIATLAKSLDVELSREGVNLTRYHGASALSSFWLTQSQAKTEYYNYRFKRQLSPELHKAVRQSSYGGRAEQFKIGTVENVYVYDINSAYAYATAQLPQMLRKPTLKREWEPAPFSIWYCEYDLTKAAEIPYFGLLPNREVTNATKYKLKGRGYFWQPEICYIAEHYPECIKIGKGFVLGYERAEFAKEIEILYLLRLELQRRGSPLERVFKLALASLYGKFCQHNGHSHYYNLFYAGYITSLTRSKLLEATHGALQSETICFQTDAIHTTSGNLGVAISDRLGDFKQSSYERVTYIDNGIYRAYDRSGAIVKSKTRGYREFEFSKALAEIQDRQQYTAIAEFFVGYNLHVQNMFTGAPYLTHFKATKVNAPFENDRAAMRMFEVLGVDLNTGYIDSRPLQTFSGRDSAVYRQTENKIANMALDTLEAGR